MTPRASGASSTPASKTTAEPQAAKQAVSEPPQPATQAAPAPSLLERLRRNRMGGLTAGLVVAVLLGLLLSILVPDSQLLLALIILGLAIAAAVGFTVRYLSTDRGLLTQLAAFVSGAIGVHLLGTTGVVHQSIDGLGDLLGGAAPGWDDALLAALFTPAVSTGAVLVGLIAAIIAGWGPRD